MPAPDTGRLTDAEVICTWMEARPTYSGGQGSPGWIEDCQWAAHYRWWKWFVDKEFNHLPRELTLDALHEVEARLLAYAAPPPEHYADWGDVLDSALCEVLRVTHQWHWHATPEQKIRALATVLRPLVEQKNG